MSNPPTTPERQPGAGIRVGLGLITFVVLVAAVQAAQQIVIPILLAGFLATVGAPTLFWLQKRRVPTPVAVALVVTGMMGVVGLLALLVGRSVASFSAQLPGYRRRLDQELNEFLAWVYDLLKIPIEEASVRDLLETVDPGMAMNLVANFLTQLSGALTHAFLIIFTMIFILLEASSFSSKLRAVLGESHAGMQFLHRFFNSLKRYLALKSLISLITGALVTIWVTLLGLDYPLVWGLVAFLLNYIPSIGSVLAAVPAVLLGIIQFGFGRALVVAIGYAVVNVVMGNILEPRIMGHGLGLSTLVVFLSLVFWGWVLGPIGMLLAVPLTMTIKIAMESRERTRWVAMLLGPESG